MMRGKQHSYPKNFTNTQSAPLTFSWSQPFHSTSFGQHHLYFHISPPDVVSLRRMSQGAVRRCDPNTFGPVPSDPSPPLWCLCSHYFPLVPDSGAVCSSETLWRIGSTQRPRPFVSTHSGRPHLNRSQVLVSLRGRLKTRTRKPTFVVNRLLWLNANTTEWSWNYVNAKPNNKYVFPWGRK